MAEEDKNTIRNIKLFLAIFVGFFIACFLIGLLKAREVGKQFYKDDYWIISYVSDNTSILFDNNVYKLLFKNPENEMTFLCDLSTNKISEFHGKDDNNEFADFNMLNSQTVELGVGIITSTMIAAHKDSIKAMYIKRPKSGIGAVLTALSAAISGYWLGYKIGMPNLKPDSLTLRKYLANLENWKQIKKASLIAVFLLPLKNMVEEVEAPKGRNRFDYHGLMKTKIFQELKNLSMRISEIDYVISNDDFIEAVKISKQIIELEPKEEIVRKYSLSKIILNNPLRLDGELLMLKAIENLPNNFEAGFETAIEKEMKETELSREEVLIKNAW